MDQYVSALIAGALIGRVCVAHVTASRVARTPTPPRTRLKVALESAEGGLDRVRDRRDGIAHQREGEGARKDGAAAEDRCEHSAPQRARSAEKCRPGFPALR